MAKIAAMGCIICELVLKEYGTPAQVHHVKTRPGWGRSSHFATIPLCFEHHQGNLGFHMIGRTRFKFIYGYSELELLDIVTERLAA